MVRFYRKFFNHQHPLLLLPLVIVAVWLRFLLLTGLTLIGKLKPGRSRGHAEFSIRPEAPKLPKMVTSDSSAHESSEIASDPMLTISAQEAKRPNSRLH